MRAMTARGVNGYGDLKLVNLLLSARETSDRLFSDRGDSLTKKGKQLGQHKHYHGYTLRTIDRCNRAGSF